MSPYGTDCTFFCMRKRHLEIVCETKFHMSVGKTKFYAVKLACAYTIFILLMLGLVLLHLPGFQLIQELHEVYYPARFETPHMDYVH